MENLFYGQHGGALPSLEPLEFDYMPTSMDCEIRSRSSKGNTLISSFAGISRIVNARL